MQFLLAEERALEVLESFRSAGPGDKARRLLACVCTLLHNRLALAPSAEARQAATQALVREQ